VLIFALITTGLLLLLAVVHAIAVIYRIRLRSSGHDLVLLANGIFLVPFLFSLVFNFRERFDGRCLSGSETGEFIEPLYFSYLTWTSLGYGDLYPIGFCRGVAVLECLIGYLFMAVLAARFYAELTVGRTEPADD
jgi:ion channel